jgi:hypothetical protein
MKAISFERDEKKSASNVTAIAEIKGQSIEG